MRLNIHDFLADESGQTTTEYVLMLAVGVTIVMQFRHKMVGLLTKLMGKIDDGTNDIICDPNTSANC